MIAYWAHLDAIPLNTAEELFCLHMGVAGLEDCPLEAQQDALSFLNRAYAFPVKGDTPATEEQWEVIRRMAEGCVQPRAYRYGGGENILPLYFGLSQEQMENLSSRGADKIIAGLAGFFFKVCGKSNALDEFEAMMRPGNLPCDAPQQ
jgi:hypothetical protein